MSFRRRSEHQNTFVVFFIFIGSILTNIIVLIAKFECWAISIVFKELVHQFLVLAWRRPFLNYHFSWLWWLDLVLWLQEFRSIARDCNMSDRFFEHSELILVRESVAAINVSVFLIHDFLRSPWSNLFVLYVCSTRYLLLNYLQRKFLSHLIWWYIWLL